MTVLWGLVIIGVWAFSQVIGAILGALGSPEFENLKEAFLNSKTEEVEALMTYGSYLELLLNLLRAISRAWRQTSWKRSWQTLQT